MIAQLTAVPPLLLLLLLWQIPAALLIITRGLWRRTYAAATLLKRLERFWQRLRTNPWILLVGAAAVFSNLFLLALTIISYGLSRRMTRPYPYEVTLPEGTTFVAEEIFIPSSDDITLASWFVPPQNGAIIILLPGYSGNRTEMIWHAERLVEAGFGVLLYDTRGTAESTGNQRSFGWQDPLDVAEAIAYLRQRPEANSARMGMVGCSVGGQIALHSAAQLPEIEAVWADGASALRAADYKGMDSRFGNFLMLTTHFSDGMMAWRLGVKPPAPLYQLVVEIAPRPIMLLAGGNNQHDISRIETYAAVAGANATVWLVPDGTHCDGHLVQPDEYAARLVGFFEGALLVTE